MKAELAGLYKLDAKKLDADGNVVSSRPLLDWFDNLILDAGLNQIGSGGVLSRAMVGGSSSAPLAGQSGLITPIANTTNIIDASAGTDLGNGYCYVRRTYRFAQGVAAGNLNEVGVGWGANLCFSRALTVDALNAPTTITVASDEVLDLTYELRVYWPTGDFTGNLTLDGNNYAFTARAASVGSWQTQLLGLFLGQGMMIPVTVGVAFFTGGNVAGLGAITAGPNGTQYLSLQPSFAAYSNNSYRRDSQVVYGVAETQNPISGMVFYSHMSIFKCAFNPSIPKNNTNTFTLGFHFSWARKSI